MEPNKEKKPFLGREAGSIVLFASPWAVCEAFSARVPVLNGTDVEVRGVFLPGKSVLEALDEAGALCKDGETVLNTIPVESEPKRPKWWEWLNAHSPEIAEIAWEWRSFDKDEHLHSYLENFGDAFYWNGEDLPGFKGDEEDYLFWDQVDTAVARRDPSLIPSEIPANILATKGCSKRGKEVQP